MHLAVFLPNWVGDAVMATPALRALRQQFPDAWLTLVVRPQIVGVFEGCPWWNALLPLSRSGSWASSWLGVAWQLRHHRPDLAVLFPNSLRPALAAWLAGSRRSIGYERYGRGWLLTDRLKPKRDARGHLTPSPVIDAYNLLAQRAGCPWPGHRLELFTTHEDEQAADAIWQRAGFSPAAEVICLNPGAAFGAAKHWSSASFGKLARRLIDERGSKVLVLCGPGERDLAREIALHANRPGVFTLAEEALSLGLSKACVRRADLLITTDSGPRHFAAAFDRPVVTLFGPTHIAWTETYYAGAVHLQKQVECGPCQLRTCPLDHRCMTLLTPAEVFAATGELLARWPKRKAS